MMEDYALRYVPESFRKWPEFTVANTAIGGISFLALEAIGASIAISYGFSNAFWAILVVGFIIFFTNLPIAYYSAKHNLDIDLLTRGAGFGYLGSTITSLIYASFTFIFFALEAAIMAQALELYFNLPLSIGYILCSLIIIPLVFFGITLINQIQFWTQPLWLVLMVAPFAFVYHKAPETFSQVQFFAGQSPSGASFDPLLFGAAATVSFALIVQIGEQADYLRFLPEKRKQNTRKWWTAMLVAGPGWIVLGVAKQLGGILLVFLAITQGLAITNAVEPTHMYIAGYSYVFSSPAIILSVTTLFVVVSQIKINVTNAYAGSIAWSNFFSRLTHRHPGRVVWLIFNILIALLLMELGVFAALEKVLGLYANVAVAWIGALFADLAINKPLGLSPTHIEYKRGHLYNINPVGTGSMLVASMISIAAFFGLFGTTLQAFSPFIALVIAILLAPIIAFLTQGKYYITRQSSQPGTCIICEQQYVTQDNVTCPVYGGLICSLCCSLDARCGNACNKTYKPRNLITRFINIKMQSSIFRFLGIFLFFSCSMGVIFGIVFYQQSISQFLAPEILEQLKTMFFRIYAAILVILGMGVWWFVLTEKSHQLAQDEVDAQNIQLQNEISVREGVEQRLAREKRILEKVANGKALTTILDSIANDVEADNKNWLCLILLHSNNGKNFQVGTAPSLSGLINTRINSFIDGSNEISWSNTGLTCERTILKDIQTHHALSNEFKEMAAKVTMTSCWFERILSTHGDMLGIFVIYLRSSTRSAQNEFEGLSSYTHLAGIAIERTRIEEKQQLANKLIWKQANYDALTGLPNRSMFQDRLEQEIKKSYRTKQKMVLMFIDLDKFKAINDTLGHNKGDILLTEVAQRIRSCVRESDTVARLGGDEFTIILPALDENFKIDRIAQEILNKLAAPFNLKGELAFITASIGITLFPEDAKTSELLMINADHAMYTAKNAGRNRYSYFTASLQLASQKRMQLIRDLRFALTKKQFMLKFQPIVELMNGRVHKAEALIRWNHPKHGWISPKEFIPLAEESGIIVEIGDWVFRDALQRTKYFRKKIHPDFQISINKSPIQFRDKSDLFQKWLPYMEELGLPGESLAIEITEGLLLDIDKNVTDKLLILRDAGIQVTIDDFGTGYSSLSYLNKLDIDYLKIDQSFVHNMIDRSENMALCEAIITMAHKLGLKVIAEGIETKYQCQLLTSIGCDYGQGFFFSKPLTAEMLTKIATDPHGGSG